MGAKAVPEEVRKFVLVETLIAAIVTAIDSVPSMSLACSAGAGDVVAFGRRLDVGAERYRDPDLVSASELRARHGAGLSAADEESPPDEEPGFGTHGNRRVYHRMTIECTIDP
jgi:hypothetical protein